MPKGTLSITNTELLNRLQKSFIDSNQKKELATLIPEMTDGERKELIALINQSNEEAAKANSEYQAKVANLNKEYEIKMNNLVKESTESAFKDYEKKEKTEEVETLKAFEGEIVTISDPVMTSSDTVKKKHTFRNLFLIFLVLALLSGVALYALNYLSAK
jgi:hypothetical protein